MSAGRIAIGRGAAIMLAVDIIALAGFYLAMPSLRRPFELLMLLLAVICAATAATVKRNIPRGFLVALASIAFALFLLEMAEKFLGITGWMQPRAAHIDTGGPKGQAGYSWEIGNPGSYLQAKDRALGDGVMPEALADNFAGDIFAGRDRSSLVTGKRSVGMAEAITEGYKRFYLTDTGLGYEHNPDNLARDYGRDEASGRLVFDAAYRINPLGFRETRGSPDADEAFVFIGDSFTFGAFLNGDETAAHYFSEAHGFAKNVINLGVMGWGPHHVLRDLELNRHLSPALGENSRVRGVFFGLIDTHADRAATPTPKYMTAPYYVLNDDGQLEFRSRASRSGFGENLAGMMEKSRVYPVLRDRLYQRVHAGDSGYKWRLTVALLREIDRLCRDRYGVPLTVVYWDDNAAVANMLRKAGLGVVPIADALPDGADWRSKAIQYMTFDGHPSAFANKKLAQYLFTMETREGH